MCRHDVGVGEVAGRIDSNIVALAMRDRRPGAVATQFCVAGGASPWPESPAADPEYGRGVEAEPLVVCPYDAHWRGEFERLRDRALRVVGDLAISVEHEGSTAVGALSNRSGQPDRYALKHEFIQHVLRSSGR